jgi:hypothetical protein
MVMRSSVLSAQEWLFCRVICSGAHVGDLALAMCVEGIVVNTLGYQDQIGKAKVNGQGNNGRNEPGEESTREVCYISNEPD